MSGIVRVSLADRFWAKVDKDGPNGCWVWTAITDRGGYGRFHLLADGQQGRRTVRAHRVAYEMLVGPIPDGQDIDHACHKADGTCSGGRTCPHRRCVNPAHLEPATRKVNLNRGVRHATPPTRCKNGHPFTPDNTYVRSDGRGRDCRACRRERHRRYHQRRRTA